MNAKSLIWKLPLALAGVIAGIALLAVITLIGVICLPSARQHVLREAIAAANEQTDWDIDLGSLYLSPFHHSPVRLYRAYKGEEDLPVQMAVDSLFIGHRGLDTLIYTRRLQLSAVLQTTSRQSSLPPIRIDSLLLRRTTFHSDSLIAAVGIDVVLDQLDVASPEINIPAGQYPLHGLRLRDADIAIDLRPDTTAPAPDDSSPLPMAFEAPDAELDNIRFRLTPLGMDIRAEKLATDVLADVGGNRYDARRIDIGALVFSLGSLRIPADTIYGDALVDLAQNVITSNGLHVRSDEIGAKADLQATRMNLHSMQVNATADADFRGSKARLKAVYDIDDEAYDATVHIDRVNLAPFLQTANGQPPTTIRLAGDIEATGQGINPKRPLASRIKMHLDEAVYDTYDLSGTNIDFATDTATSLALTTQGLDADIHSPMPLFPLIDRVMNLVQTVSDSAVLDGLTSLRELTLLDTIRRQIPPLKADISLRKGSPVQPIIDSTGLDIDKVLLALSSDTLHTALDLRTALSASSSRLSLPPVQAAVTIGMDEGATDLALTADTRLTDGVMSVEGLCTDAALQMNIRRRTNELRGEGRLTADSLTFKEMVLGNRTVDIQLAPSQEYAHAVRADVQLDDIPLDIIESFVHLPDDIALRGSVRANASVDGLPQKTDISAQVKPLAVAAEYKPYQVAISLGETPIVMEHNRVDLNGLPVYGADSTFIALSGGLDLNTMRMDVVLQADSFAPVKLAKGGPLPVYGDLATDIRGKVTGPLDSIVADVDVTILPTTDITYPIDKKNLAQVKPHGAVNVRYGTADGELNLGGQINVDDGMVRYSPKIYPVMPFHVDSGSHIAFNGPIGKTRLAVSASQQVKADVESDDEDTRRVAFRTGVRVNGELDSIGIESIGFFLEAPEDETITRELASVDEGTREGLAATLLATGMYVGESNVAAQREGYALSSIINSRINAAMANSRLGKIVDVDISSGQTQHAAGKSNDMNIAISKSFFHDKLRITVGSTISDNPDVNKTNGLLSSITADYRILPNSSTQHSSTQALNTQPSTLSLRLFSQRDYNNILEGELNKSGLAIRATKDWKQKSSFHHSINPSITNDQLPTIDSITRTHSLVTDAGIAYRSNNSIGPDLTLKYTLKNLFGKGESFSLKGNGAYYWALRNRHPGDPKKTDTYKLGLNASLIFPYLHWTGENNPDGDTRYMIGYQYENIAGGYGVHKLSGSFTYFIRSPYNPYITHEFTPFSLSVVMMKAEAEDLLDKAAEYPQLIKILAGDEFVPAISYNFTYNDYRAKRAVNTMLDLGVKESGNLINALYCLAGKKWDDPKQLGSITFNQFVKLSAELRNKFNLTDRVCIATRLFAGANIPLGNSMFAPLSEAFYAGGPNSMRSASPYAYGPGNFYSAKYNQNFFHAGDLKLEANFELRFPIVWKLYGAAFVDAGNVWNWFSTVDLYKAAGLEDYLTRLEIPENLYDGIYNNPYFAQQIALGTGAGLRLDIDGLVIRLDLGVGIHAPYQTFKYDKEGKTDTTQPINTYFNIPSALDALRLNFGIGYPF